MWSIWFTYYMHIEQVYCVYSNLVAYTHSNDSCLSINRREPGLHFFRKNHTSFCKLLRVWRKEFAVFPKDVVRLDWDASKISGRPY
jgi:hypothetical protein